MMAITNHARVGKALELLRAGLTPFVEREFKATLVAKLGAKAEVARELCYRLYALSERKKRAAEALAYNALVQSWPEITRLARESREVLAEPLQTSLL